MFIKKMPFNLSRTSYVSGTRTVVYTPDITSFVFDFFVKNLYLRSDDNTREIYFNCEWLLDPLTPSIEKIRNNAIIYYGNNAVPYDVDFTFTSSYNYTTLKNTINTTYTFSRSIVLPSNITASGNLPCSLLAVGWDS